MLGSIKTKYVDDQISRLPSGSQGTVKIKRAYAQRFADSGKCDHTGEYTIFGQIHQAIKNGNLASTVFRMNDTDSQMYECLLAGEGAQDVGGPFRESLSNIVCELESAALPLLIETVNHRNDHGVCRECYTLNSASTTPTHAELFKVFGYFLGFAIRSKSAMNWHFPPLIWKQIIGETPTDQDLEGIDAYSYKVLKDIRSHARRAPELFDQAVQETFETYLSNGQAVELCPGGKERQVTHENYEEYIDLVVATRLNECRKQMEWLKEGIHYVIGADILSFLTWEDVELRACGPKDVQTEALKAVSQSNVGDDHKCIRWFWEMFEAFTQEERRKYLKFVWGRSKLPADTARLEYQHQVRVYSHID